MASGHSHVGFPMNELGPASGRGEFGQRLPAIVTPEPRQADLVAQSHEILDDRINEEVSGEICIMWRVSSGLALPAKQCFSI